MQLDIDQWFAFRIGVGFGIEFLRPDRCREDVRLTQGIGQGGVRMRPSQLGEFTLKAADCLGDRMVTCHPVNV